MIKQRPIKLTFRNLIRSVQKPPRACQIHAQVYSCSSFQNTYLELKSFILRSLKETTAFPAGYSALFRALLVG